MTRFDPYGGLLYSDPYAPGELWSENRQGDDDHRWRGDVHPPKPGPCEQHTFTEHHNFAYGTYWLCACGEVTTKP